MEDGVERRFLLTDRVAIVTGGGTGIGAAIARIFARAGAHVVITSRKMENLERVASEIESETGRRGLPIPADVRDENQVTGMLAQVVKAFGRVDVLVNNAGGSRLVPLSNTDVPRFDNTLNLNLRGPFMCIQAVGPHMIARRQGAIVNISSGAGVHGTLGGSAYSAAKAGLQMLTQVVAAEWGPYGIRANCIAVGAIATESAVRSWNSSGIKPDDFARDRPLRRVGTPEEIAYPALFLASDAAAFVTGQTFAADGGPTMGGLPPAEG